LVNGQYYLGNRSLQEAFITVGGISVNRMVYGT
jgi:hypothetical protein